MRARRVIGTALSTLAVAAGLAPTAAHAATPVNLVVSTPVWNCSDTDPARPFCTVAAALASPQLVPGSTITINGYHNEQTTVSTSGITLQGDGTVVGLTVSHAQNLTVKATSSSGLWVTDLAVQQSSDVGLHGLIHHNVVYQVRTDHYAALVAQPADDSQVLGQQSDLRGDPVATGPAYSKYDGGETEPVGRRPS